MTGLHLYTGDDDLLAWGSRYLSDYFTRPPSAMHRWLAEHLAAMQTHRGTKLNCIGPRGSAKSTLASLAYPLRAALERQEPYIWIVSDTRDQAVGHLENLKQELVDNERLAEDYAEAVGRGPRWRASAITLRNGIAIEALSTGQRIRGRRYRQHRPTLIVCDDLQNDRHIESARQRELSRQWFQGSLLKAGTKETNILHLATALHREALALELSRTPGWLSRSFSSIERWPDNLLLWQEWESIYSDTERTDHLAEAAAFYAAHREEMDAGAVLLWPQEEDLYTLMRLRAEGGRLAFEREKQSSPMNPELCEWPESYFDAAVWFEQWPRRLQCKIMTLDPSKGRDASRGDYSAYVMMGIDAAGLMLVEADLKRRHTRDMVVDGVALYRRFRPDAFGVETVQYQELLVDLFSQEFRNQGLLGFHPWPLDNRLNKEMRIRRLTPYLCGRRMRFLRGSPSTQLLVDQLRDFPVAAHDDGPDALEMALQVLEQLSEPRNHDGLGNRLLVG